jgi:hypothetical protein
MEYKWNTFLADNNKKKLFKQCKIDVAIILISNVLFMSEVLFSHRFLTCAWRSLVNKPIHVAPSTVRVSSKYSCDCPSFYSYIVTEVLLAQINIYIRYDGIYFILNFNVQFAGDIWDYSKSFAVKYIDAF